MGRLDRGIKIGLSLALAGFAGMRAWAQDAPQTPQIRFGAQQQAAAQGGSVTGHVFSGDTQRPARFAQVMLIPAEEATASPGSNREFMGRRSTARTDLDGMFTATNVAAGDYYVSGVATGYVSEGALMLAAGTDLGSALSKLPSVHVVAGSVSTVNVTLERGGVIAGRAQWDDGSAATGVQVSVVNAAPATSSTPGGGRIGGGFGFFGGGGEGGMTDDRGQFRITGLAPGDYLVRTTMQAPVPGSSGGPGGFGGGRNSIIVLYAPGKVRRTDAQTVTIHAGEDRNDLTIMLDLSALHRVSGHVGATSGTVASGTVRLTDSQDSSLSRTAAIGSDGNYLLNYVPAGTYTLSVPSASSAATQQGRGGRGGGASSTSTATTFQPFQETLTVTDGDLSGIDVNLTPSTPTQSSQ